MENLVHIVNKLQDVCASSGHQLFDLPQIVVVSPLVDPFHDGHPKNKFPYDIPLAGWKSKQWKKYHPIQIELFLSS